MRSIIIITVATLGLSITSASAQSVCKGLDQAQCSTKQVFQGINACGWVGERVTVTGKTISGYCRGSTKSLTPAQAEALKNGQLAKAQ